MLKKGQSVKIPYTFDHVVSLREKNPENSFVSKHKKLNSQIPTSIEKNKKIH